ncbi:Zinc finger C2H2-type [Cinara cedri]|uniref:Zinc finger C2H2-type n=1 Tax=Cinara cedri TaxID=506608 RepID=A0A5E4MNT5_9HEMI|nr:Zinc finger C2H2-type [Cinara cedri]
MPKIKSTLGSKISNWIALYNENKEVFSSDGKVTYCLVCNKSVSTENQFLLDRHSKTIQHINALQRNKEKNSF